MAIFTSETTTADFVRQSMQDGGGTLFPNTIFTFTGGYMVGRSDLLPSTTLQRVTHTSSSLLMAVERVREIARVAGEYADMETLAVGIWVDDKGAVWVDLSQHTDSLEEATELGKSLGELAIYDIRANKSINL